MQLIDIPEKIEIESIEENIGILREGLSALASIHESCHAVSTAKRFHEFCRKRGINYLERDLNWRDLEEGFELFSTEKIQRFKLIKEFRQRGYGAMHIGSKISELRERGYSILIINGRRNRRFLLVKEGENGRNR